MPKANLSPGKKKQRKCLICHVQFRAQGYPAHVKKCQNEQEVRRAERKHAKFREKRLRRLDTLAPRGTILDEHPDLSDAFATAKPMDLDMGFETSLRDSEPSPPSVAQTAGPSGGPETHKFTIEYHPNSGRATETQGLDGDNKKPSPPRNLEPWSPFFKSREDFEIAEVIMRLGVPKADCNRLFKAIRRCLVGEGSFNLKKFSDVQNAWSAWKQASSQLATI